MNNNLLTIVKQIITDYGETILADPKRLKAFFSDLAKDEPKPLRIAFGRCIEAGAYAALKGTADKSERVEHKMFIAQKVHGEHGLDIGLCNEALDILEVAVFGITSTAYPQPVQQQFQYPIQSEAITPPTVYVNNPVASPASTKKHTFRIILIVAIVLIAIVIGIMVAMPDLQPAWLLRSVKLNEHDQIILTQKKNNDGRESSLRLTLRDVKATQKFIKKNFPEFDFEEEGYVTDDYRNELLIKEFNENPKILSIYLGGIKEMAGKSQVYAGLFASDDELFFYYFSIDQEFSDTSGFEYYSGYYPVTWKRDNGQIGSIQLRKYLFADTNEPYWIIVWDDDIPKRERLELLNDFLSSLRYTKVFKNFAFDFLKDVFTGIDQYQTIENIVDWWGVKPPVSYTEDIYIESRGRLNYTLSNYASEIERAIYQQEGKDVNLDEINWFVNGSLSANVKAAMNRLNVNYSYPAKGGSIVNKRVENTWHSAYFK